MCDVRKVLVNLMNNYLEAHEENPTRIYVTKVFENEMTAAGSECWDRLAAVSVIEGIRKALGEPALFGGCLLIWDSDEMKADRVEEDLSIIRSVLMAKNEELK